MKSARSNVVKTTKTPGRNGRIGSSNEELNKKQDPVEVYCRIRPLINSSDNVCVTLTSPTTVTLSPPESVRNRRILQYGFKHVFTEHSTQKELFECIAMPLLDGLLQGKNGLLFTYGVTGSGKTFTMTGEPNDPGLMPTCINTIFNSITQSQTPKFVIKSDKMNGFEVQSGTDALSDRLREAKSKSKSSLKRYHGDVKDISNYQNDGIKLNNIQKNCLYAVFVNYIEIYNNTVYDLLDDSTGTRTLQPKILREDSNRNMYVNGVVELEVKSAEEAFELFNIGQKRKRMAHTTMNTESSRSHSIFTIRLVQGIFDDSGEFLSGMEDHLLVSQLSLVDLAGSERCSRTQTTGQRLKEAGCINNSLMSLRTCLEILRENQQNGMNRIVPYRDSRLTHIFKNFFDGEGKVEMIVCINPSVNDYDETLQVMKFAEITQEVKIQRPEARFLNAEEIEQEHNAKKQRLMETPRSVKSYKLSKIQSRSIKKEESILQRQFLLEPESDKISELVMYLKSYQQKRLVKINHINKKCNSFRKNLVDLNKNNLALKSEITSLQTLLKRKRSFADKMQQQKLNMEVAIESLNKENDEKGRLIEKLQETVKEKNFKLNQNYIDKETEKRKLEEKMTHELDAKLRHQRNILTAAVKKETEKIELVKDILMSNTPVPPSTRTEYHSVKSQSDINSIKTTVKSFEDKFTAAQTGTHTNLSSRRATPVANPRYRRSKSAGDVWLEHRPSKPTPLGTVFQPVMKRRKSITKLTDVRDIVSPKQSKYVLIHQGEDEEGDLETKLYKGDIIPTRSGGAQIIFDDVEKLKQQSP